MTPSSPSPDSRPWRSTAPRPRGWAPTALTLLAAAHPAPTVLVTTLCTVLAAAVGSGLAGSTLVGLAVLSGQLSIGWCNDYLDRGRDAATGRADKPLTRGVLEPRLVALATGAALVACVPLSLANGVAAGLVHLVVVASGWAYDLGLKRTRCSPVPYAVAFGLLPGFVVMSLPGHPLPPLWLVLSGSVLGVGAHFANAAPDVDDDLATGVRGLPQLLGRRRSQAWSAAALVTASALLVLGPPGPPGAARWSALFLTAALTLAGVALPGAGHARVPFVTTMGIATVDVVLLVTGGATLG